VKIERGSHALAYRLADAGHGIDFARYSQKLSATCDEISKDRYLSMNLGGHFSRRCIFSFLPFFPGDLKFANFSHR
jgi:hypothetical protein